ncbi:glutamate racemase [uncultured Paludibaculum sp.]|uniref:glutamate racemase n=1 Tax=uncultured Paludibaculum sp. TaxID=1765020 RepID=UPI002AAAE946|nr:glutamate racemase [uncultured Paludibaculum sp.]
MTHPNPIDGTAPAARRRIGIFDSGVGGLTVLKAMRRTLPQTDFLYVGDTARVPYGRKPAAMVAGFAREIAGFLLAQDVEAIVVACNTATAAALPTLAEELPVPVWGVIEPGVQAAFQTTRSGSVGVIGTRGAIASGAYQRRLEALGLRVWARACPMFVHLVEENLSGSEEAALLTRYYFADRPEIDTLILGCTHYPVLRPIIEETLGPGVTVISSAQAVAATVAAAFGETEDPSLPGTGGILHLVTGDVIAYQHTAQTIGGVDGEVRPIHVETLAAAQPLHAGV